MQAALALGWDVFSNLIVLLANASSKLQDNTEGDLTGDYNFRTRKFDNGADPYGWYEEDL